MTAAEKLAMTYAEYLALERASTERHQFVEGVAYAMAGGSPTHSRLAVRVSVALANLLQPGRGHCDVYSSDAKIHVLASGDSYYPDVSVVCDPVAVAPMDANAMTNPTLLVEVLSDTTERFDRGSKFADYQRIPSLRHYVLVAQDKVRVEHFRRNDDDTWTLSVAQAGGIVRLPDLGGELVVDAIYRGVSLPERTSPST